MKKVIGFCQFTDEFRDMGRENQFSYYGLKALYEYLTELEDQLEDDIDLDVISLCCDFWEDDLDEILKYYDLESIDELRDNTLVLEVENSTNVIVQSY